MISVCERTTPLSLVIVVVVVVIVVVVSVEVTKFFNYNIHRFKAYKVIAHH